MLSLLPQLSAFCSFPSEFFPEGSKAKASAFETMFRALGAALMRPSSVLLAKYVYVGNLPYGVTEAEVEKGG